jgi:hypothetical protein
MRRNKCVDFDARFICGIADRFEGIPTSRHRIGEIPNFARDCLAILSGQRPFGTPVATLTKAHIGVPFLRAISSGSIARFDFVIPDPCAALAKTRSVKWSQL